MGMHELECGETFQEQQDYGSFVRKEKSIPNLQEAFFKTDKRAVDDNILNTSSDDDDSVDEANFRALFDKNPINSFSHFSPSAKVQ